MFTRSTLLVLLAALAAGLGFWAAQLHYRSAPAVDAGASAQIEPATSIDPAQLKTVRLYPQPRQLPPFELRQSDGTTLTGDELHGHWTIVFLGFTHCPDVCPTTLSDLAQAQKAWADLPADARPRVLFVSVDPERDTPEATGNYAAYFHPDTLAATADRGPLEAFAGSLGLVFMKVAGVDDSDYTMDHSTALVVLDPAARPAGLIRPPLVPAEIAADLATLTQAAGR